MLLVYIDIFSILYAVECAMISKMVNRQMRAEFITPKEDHIHQVPLLSIYQNECIQDLLPTTWLVG